jgi:hypothetical protein
MVSGKRLRLYTKIPTTPNKNKTNAVLITEERYDVRNLLETIFFTFNDILKKNNNAAKIILSFESNISNVPSDAFQIVGDV